MFSLTIDGLPVSQKNKRPILRNRATGKPFIGTATNVRQWKTSAVRQLKQQWAGADKLEGDIQIHLAIYQGKRQALDADNAIAGAFDALQKAKVIRNDYQLAQGSWARWRDRDRPRIEITLTPVGDPPGKVTQNASGSETVHARRRRGTRRAR